jgi:hypothetical protein
MKHPYFLILLVALFSAAGSAKAQPPGQGPNRERIEAQRVAFITSKLALTADESAKFWPVYNAHRAAMKDMREDWARPDIATMSDADAERLLDEQLKQEYRKLELRKELVAKLRSILPARKILMLPAAEAEFNRELLRRVQEGRPPR